MAFITEARVRRLAEERVYGRYSTYAAALKGDARAERSHYDIFLSQTIKDAPIVYGAYTLLTSKGYTVFCDWIEAPDVNRAEVTPENAEAIRKKMKACDTLLFLDTQNADQSKWMCWEVGWFDGAKSKVAVLPVLQSGAAGYRGREFLGLYPYITEDTAATLKVNRPHDRATKAQILFEATGADNSASFNYWRSADADHMRP